MQRYEKTKKIMFILQNMPASIYSQRKFPLRTFAKYFRFFRFYFSFLLTLFEFFERLVKIAKKSQSEEK